MNTQFDPQGLDAALAELADAAQTARDCYLMSETDEALNAFNRAIAALSQAAQQISLSHRK